MPAKHKSAPPSQKAKLTSKRKYVRVADRRQGLEVTTRTQSKEVKNSNQWVSDPRHDLFVTYWLLPDIDGVTNPLFGNAYQSALKAGFSPNHSKNITTNVLSLEWVKEAKGRLARFNPEHIVKKLELLTNATKDSDKIRALELLARINGLFIDRSISQIDVQFTNAVPRPVTDVEPIREAEEAEVVPPTTPGV